jgi:hypothetical protein
MSALFIKPPPQYKKISACTIAEKIICEGGVAPEIFYQLKTENL